MRHKAIDGLRGIFLLSMALTHFDMVLGTGLGTINLNRLGWFDAVQGFVFVSGLMVGMAYGRRYLLDGWSALKSAVFSRIRNIYQIYAILLVVLLGAVLFVLPAGWRPQGLDGAAQAPATMAFLQLSMIGSMPHMSILPMYVIFMAVTPLVLRALGGGHYAAVMLGSLGIWFVAQTGIFSAAEAAGEAALGGDLPLGLYFNLAGWQLLYVMGLVFGMAVEKGEVVADRLFAGPQWRACFFVALGIAAVLVVMRTIIHVEAFLPRLSAAFMAAHPRQSLGVPFVISFGLGAFGVAYLLTAGRQGSAGFFGSASRLLAWTLRHRWVTLLGRASLTVIAFHILVTYALGIVIEGAAPPLVVRVGLLGVAIGSLFVPAIIQDRRRVWVGVRIRAAAIAR